MDRPSKIVFFVLSAVSIFLMALPNAHIAGWARVALGYVFLPHIKTADNVEQYFSNIPQNALDFLSAAKENEKLKNRIKELEISLFMARELAEENKTLSEILKLPAQIPFKGVWARVVSREMLSWHNRLLINKGGLQAVKKADAVANIANGQVCLVGKVVQIWPSSAQVMLITDEMSSVAVSAGSWEGLVKGENSEKLFLSYISRSADLSAGADVFTSRASSVFPAGIKVGNIEKVFSSAQDSPFISARVAPCADMGALKELFVISNGVRNDAGNDT